jgi:hypothetical protein
VTADVASFTAAFAILATFVVAGSVLLFSEIRRLERKIDDGLTGLRGEIGGLRRDLAEEFRA